MVIDCFLFNREFDLLELRLKELENVVDHFLLVEADVTFSGKEKPMWWYADGWRATANNRYNHPKLTSVQVIDPPKTSNPWDRETYQRNSILRGLHTFPDDTIILLSDADEIPCANSVPSVISQRGTVYVYEQELYYYTMNQRAREKWRGTRACRLDDLRNWTPQVVRFSGGIPVHMGGWHFSYMGGVDSIQRKIADFSHQEYNKGQYTSSVAIKQRVDGNRDLFDREIINLITVPGLSHLPRYVQDNPDRFAVMLNEG